MQRGTRQRVPLVKIGVVVQHTSCRARISDIHLQCFSCEGALHCPVYAVLAIFYTRHSSFIDMDWHELKSVYGRRLVRAKTLAVSAA